MPLRASTPSEIERLFAEIAQNAPDAIIVSSIGDLVARRQLIVDLIGKSRLPAIYPYRDFVKAGGLMAYSTDDRELSRHMADDVHKILGGAKPGDIPIYQPAKFELVINLNIAKVLGLEFPAALLAEADEVIE